MAVDRAKIGRRNRAKGAEFERAVAKVVLEQTGVRLKRELRQTAEREREDLVDETGAFPFAPECKTSTGSTFLSAWYEQAQVAAEKAGLYPAVVYRIARRPMRVRVPSTALAEAHGAARAPDGSPLWWADLDMETWCLVAAEIMAVRTAGAEAA